MKTNSMIESTEELALITTKEVIIFMIQHDIQADRRSGLLPLGK